MIYIKREKLINELSLSNISCVTAEHAEKIKREELVRMIDRMLPEAVEDTAGEDLADEVDFVMNGGFVTETVDECSFGHSLSDRALSMEINEEILADTDYVGEVLGKCNSESGEYYALFKNEKLEHKSNVLGDTSVGIILSAKVYKKVKSAEVCFEGYDWFGAYVDGVWMFNTACGGFEKITVTGKVSFVTTAFSRNLGLLETDIMKEKTAIVVGCGSVGSYIIMQLAMAGVGNFIFIEFDRLKIHNLSRHWLGLSHIGEYKGDAMAMEVRRKNPNANIKVFRGKVQDAPDELFSGIGKGGGIVIATGDNRGCDAAANRIAEKLSLPFVSAGCWTRAICGEVFRWMPGEGLPTYGEAFDGLITDETNEGHRAYFGNADEADTVRFEPGIYSDITFTSDVAVKLALDMMNIDNKNYTTRVYDHLTNYTLVCNSNNEKLGGRQAALFGTPLRITDKRDGIWLEKKGDAACLTISIE